MKIMMPYVYSRPYVYSFCQIFQALRLFPALRLFRTLVMLFQDCGVFRNILVKLVVKFSREGWFLAKVIILTGNYCIIAFKKCKVNVKKHLNLSENWFHFKMSYFGKHFLFTSIFVTLGIIKIMPNIDQKYITSWIPSMTICELIWPYSGRGTIKFIYFVAFSEYMNFMMRDERVQ